MQVQKLPTGIEGFDDVCQGGLPIGRSTLISGTSGTGKTVFSLHFLHNGIKQFDEPGIFVTFEESPLDILRNAASFGWNLQEMVEQDKLFILDASPDPDGQDVAGSFDLSGLIERINYAIRKYKAKRVAIDSMTTITHYLAGVLGLHTEIDVRAVMYDVVRALNDLAKSLGIILYAVIHPDDPANLVFEAVSDGVLDMFFYEDVGGVKQRGLRVSKMRATSHPLDTLSVFFERDGIEIETL
jgi:KaiC/GvpD/RAD55 family RecA-like ATPase